MLNPKIQSVLIRNEDVINRLKNKQIIVLQGTYQICNNDFNVQLAVIDTQGNFDNFIQDLNNANYFEEFKIKVDIPSNTYYIFSINTEESINEKIKKVNEAFVFPGVTLYELPKLDTSDTNFVVAKQALNKVFAKHKTSINELKQHNATLNLSFNSIMFFNKEIGVHECFVEFNSYDTNRDVKLFSSIIAGDPDVIQFFNDNGIILNTEFYKDDKTFCYILNKSKNPNVNIKILNECFLAFDNPAMQLPLIKGL